MKHILTALFMAISVSALAVSLPGNTEDTANASIYKSEQGFKCELNALMESNSQQVEKIFLASNDVGQCMGSCASEQGICMGQCQGNGQCISNCAAAHGRCVARCH